MQNRTDFRYFSLVSKIYLSLVCFHKDIDKKNLDKLSIFSISYEKHVRSTSSMLSHNKWLTKFELAVHLFKKVATNKNLLKPAG